MSHDPEDAPERHGLSPVQGRRLPMAMLAAVVFVGVAAGWRTWSGRAAPVGEAPATSETTVSLSEEARRQAGISTEAVRRVSRADRVTAPGVLALDERRTARLGSLVDGVVIRTMVQVGDRVKTGSVLAELHSHVVHDARANYRNALAARRTRETELTYARQAEERASRLLAAKAISRQEQQRAAANRIDAEASLEMARTELSRAEAALDHYGLTNGDEAVMDDEAIPVRSPLGGVVLEKKVTQGTAVTVGVPLFVVSDLTEIWAVAEIDETALPFVSSGQEAAIKVAAYPGEVFEGRVSFVSDMVNPRTRRVTVRCQVPNLDRRLKPEMYAALDFLAGDAREVLAVPQSAVQEIRGRPVVFVRGPDGSFERRDTTLGLEVDGWVEIRSGLNQGETVATAGSFLLKSELLRGSLPEAE